MNIIFFGSSHFGLPSLKALIEAGHNISCVVTQPDREKGRGLHIAKTIIKEFSQEKKLKIYQPENTNAQSSEELFKVLSPDLFVVIAYGQILSKGLLDIPKIMPINIHGSILPSLRGAAPINWALINGQKETGITSIKMTEKMDAGPIISQTKIAINDKDSFISLENKLSIISAQLLIDSINLIKNNLELVSQDEKKITFAPKLKKEDGLINWSKSAVEIHNLIRGCLGWPDAFTHYKRKILKIFKAEVSGLAGERVNKSEYGKIIAISKEGIRVATGKDSLLIQELQLEGKRKMRAEDFILGHKIKTGEFLGKK